MRRSLWLPLALLLALPACSQPLRSPIPDSVVCIPTGRERTVSGGGTVTLHPGETREVTLSVLVNGQPNQGEVSFIRSSSAPGALFTGGVIQPVDVLRDSLSFSGPQVTVRVRVPETARPGTSSFGVITRAQGAQCRTGSLTIEMTVLAP
ncbi:hypothetical protein QOL99_06975 [Deinococcus sp. MIMF12]|uniref:Lipoprotein n=1 Tax=Deinococcus rhizophilus TaxID=3049544 RepID=A0ABT7JFQ0_9DEIO|nr:hypothetical protein [Deinococcus rhizophilus]MDL2343890.1 hypothetical protein [Deinococcus rhizophilus]